MATPEQLVRYLTPPIIEPRNIDKQVLCHRPTRSKHPAMNALCINNQIVVNNYGHAGFGWIMAPGATEHVLSQMATLLPVKSTQLPITIIGAGIMGLSAAYQLTLQGFNNLTIVTQETDNLTSHNAVGFFSPSIELGKSWITPDIKQIIHTSYAFYQQIIESQHQDFAAKSAQFLPMYITKERKSAIRASKHPVTPVTIDFGNGASHEMVEQHGGIIIHVNLMIQQLHAFLQKHNVPIITETITKLSDLSTPVVINCAGLGARELMCDDGIVPMQGHLVHLSNQPATSLEYLIMMDCEKAFTGTGFQVKRSLYWAPRRYTMDDITLNGIIGVTSIKGANASTPHQEEFARVIERARTFFYATKN